MKRIIISTFILISAYLGFGQEFSGLTANEFSRDTNYGYFNFIQLNTHRGQHLSGSSQMQDILSNGFWGTTVRVGAQSTGRQEWQQIHNYPQYGLGVSYFDLGKTDADSVLGNPSSIFFFYSAPVKRWENWSFNTDLEIGLSYDFKPYDPETNVGQDVIGARVNLHFLINFAFYYHFTERLDISLAYGLHHFSNGRSFTPNKGINLAGFNIGAIYHLNPIKNFTKQIDPYYQPEVRPIFQKSEWSTFKPHHEIQLTATVGTTQLDPGDFKDASGVLDTTNAKGPRYGTTTMAAEYAYQSGRRFKWVGGFAFFYDGSASHLYDDVLPQDATFQDKAYGGVHGGFHYLIERFAFIANVGLYINKPFPQRGKFYMRAGGRIGLTENLDAHIALKTRNGGIADWIEWGLAYKFKISK